MAKKAASTTMKGSALTLKGSSVAKKAASMTFKGSALTLKGSSMAKKAASTTMKGSALHQKGAYVRLREATLQLRGAGVAEKAASLRAGGARSALRGAAMHQIGARVWVEGARGWREVCGVGGRASRRSCRRGLLRFGSRLDQPSAVENRRSWRAGLRGRLSRLTPLPQEAGGGKHESARRRFRGGRHRGGSRVMPRWCRVAMSMQRRWPARVRAGRGGASALTCRRRPSPCRGTWWSSPIRCRTRK